MNFIGKPFARCAFTSGKFATIALISTLFASAPVTSAPLKDAFTTINLEQCKEVETYEQGAVFSCKGLPGYGLRVAEGDLRFAIGYGGNAKNQMSMTQFLSPFNTIGKTMQWRLSQGRPVATILRYFTDEGSGGKKGQILVVTKLGKSNACHMAYVDARANRDANKLAERASQGSKNFRCGVDEPKFVGKRGVSPF